jgi:Xaa-Pro aminopeptidase
VTATPATVAERDARFARVREAMAERELDALVIGGKGHWWTGRGYVRYLTDFHLWAHDALLVFPAQGDPAIALTSYAVAGLVAERGWVTDAGGDVFLVPRTLRSLEQRKLVKGRIGIVGTEWIIPADLHRSLVDGLPSAELVAADDLMNLVRMPKSDLEIQQNREVWDLAKSAMERFAEVARPGATQLELSAEACRVALAGGARDLLVLMSETPGRMAPPDDAPVRCDDALRYHMEISGPSGHWCELTITLAYRPASDGEARLMETELRALEAVRAAARPAVRVSELAQVFEDTIRADGWELGPPTQHFDFHGQGQDVIELPWYAAEQPWGSAGDASLPVGGIVSYHPARRVEPAVGWTPGISDNLLVTAEGAEWLSGDWSHRFREAAA